VRILILGGGFGGVYTAMHLQRMLRGKHDVEIALVSKENYFVFQPMLAEVISGSLGLFDPIVPIRHLCPGATLYVGEVGEIDLARRCVRVTMVQRAQPLDIAYDYLVLALGTLDNFGVVPGLVEHGLHFKNIGDALVLRNRIIHTLESADIERDPQVRRALLTFVMAGGGFSGVEAIAEVNDFVRGVARRYPHIDPSEFQVVLLQAGPRILPELPEGLSLYAQRLLGRRQVDIRLSARLRAVTADEAILDDGTRISTRTLMATIGAAANPVLTALPCEQDHGRIVVDETLEIPGYPGVWALGDCARIIDAKTKERCPPTAQFATREAKCVAANVVATMRGGPKRSFSFTALGLMGSLGHRSAVGQLFGRVKVSGIPAWTLWRAIYWSKMPGLNRKFRVALDWALDLVLQKDLAVIDAAPTESIGREHFEPGETIFRQGDIGDRVYVIIDGEVEAVRTDASGSDTVIARLGPGDCFGEMALIHDAPRNSSARTATRVDVMTLRRTAFATLFTHLPLLRDSFTQMVERRSAEDASVFSLGKPRLSERKEIP
jgi:NADH dehydrogenase